MTVEEVFVSIVNHQIKGVMFHAQMADYFDFLSLKGYKRMHECHYYEESCEFRSTCRYYINHYGKLLPSQNIPDPEVIPSNWLKYSRSEVDISTKRNAIKKAFQQWVEWEKETKKVYQEAWTNLIQEGEVAAALFVKEMICDVDCELKCAERMELDLKSVDYSMEYILPEQDCLHEKYKKKMKHLEIHVC